MAGNSLFQPAYSKPASPSSPKTSRLLSGLAHSARRSHAIAARTFRFVKRDVRGLRQLLAGGRRRAPPSRAADADRERMNGSAAGLAPGLPGAFQLLADALGNTVGARGVRV